MADSVLMLRDDGRVESYPVINVDKVKATLYDAAGNAIDDGNPIAVSDSGEVELTPATAYITSAGTTTIHTPASGKKIELRWIYALNDPAASDPARITIKLGATTILDTFGISKRQKFVGATDALLTVTTDSAGPVAVSALLREIT